MMFCNIFIFIVNPYDDILTDNRYLNFIIRFISIIILYLMLFIKIKIYFKNINNDLEKEN